MKVKLALDRGSAGPVDIVVTSDATATVGDVVSEMVLTDPAQLLGATTSGTLEVRPPGPAEFVRLSRDTPIGDSWVASGFTARIVNAEGVQDPGARAPVAVMRVVGGPDRGLEFRLRAGATFVGRDPMADCTLTDPYVSNIHARVEVGSAVEVIDLNSANGLEADGGLVQRWTALPGQTVRLGDTELEFQRIDASGAVVDRRLPIAAGAVPFNRSPRVERRYPGREYPRPQVPRELEKPPFPWLLMLAPVVLGAVMYWMTRNPLSLLFIAMAPMMLAANFVMARQRSARQRDSEVGRFEEQFAALEAALAGEVPLEREARLAECVSTGSVMTAGMEAAPLLWTRRPEHWNFLHLRLGLGAQRSRNSIAAATEASQGLREYSERVDELTARFAQLDGVPVTEDFARAGAIGIIGQREPAAGAARALLVQLVGLHSPAEVVLAAVVSPRSTRDYDWLKWLPHTSSPHSPLANPHLADGAASAAALVSALEALVEERTHLTAPPLMGPLREEHSATAAGARVGLDEAVAAPVPAVVVLVGQGAPVERGRLVQLAERGPAVGVFTIWVADEQAGLPAACRTFTDVRDDLAAARTSFVRLGEIAEPVAVESVSVPEAMAFARKLSGMVDSGAVVADQSDLPRSVSVLSLLGRDMAMLPSVVLDRWRQNDSILDRTGGSHRPRQRVGSLRAMVGQSGADALHLDLRTQGPHALVGGTTGAGKSEFLQSWVIAMAAEYSPDRVTFLFVDYKGGAAFADCVRLPHCVGLVTDLSPHLVRRALDSLRAELRHREHLFNLHQVKDLVEFEKSGDPDCPPALVLVIDEFAALVGDVPEFVDGVVDIAQRGRSLGIHLIMATQRPAGVIRDNLRANTNLRIALRMADEADSTDVVGVPVAAGFDPGTPGRAVAKTGPGRLSSFQAAYAGGWSLRAVAKPSVEIHELRFGAETPWQRPEPEDVEVAQPDLGPTDLASLVGTAVKAAVSGAIPAPRRPWLTELARAYDVRDLQPDGHRGLLLGLSDLPHSQSQTNVYFDPDHDGNLAIYGTSGSGKTVLLRTLAAGAGLSSDAGPVHVYGLDFAAGGLRMLEVLPHVGSVIAGDDTERVIRLLRTLRELADERARTYPAADAGNIAEYRKLTGRVDEPRILVLVDGYPAFRTEYDGVGGRSQWYGVFQQLLSEGRALGIHIVFTADRPGSVPGSVAASVPERVIMRLADEAMYTALDVPNDVLSRSSPPGRALVRSVEVQVAILGGSGNVADQSEAMKALASAMVAEGRRPAPAIRSLPLEVALADLPTQVGGLPLLGISDDDLRPVGFEPRGAFLVGGGPGSGRSNALEVLVASLRRFDGAAEFWYLGNRRSAVPLHGTWQEAARTPDEVAALAKALTARISETTSERVVVVVEAVSDFVSTPADGALVELFRTVKRSDQLLIAESETSTWTSSWPIFGEVKAARRGLLLQPETIEGETILRTAFPRVSRAEFPPGRGLLVHGGKVVRVHLPLA